MKFKFLDGLRGIAAVYVMIGHARWLLWEGFSEGYNLHPHEYSLVDKVLMYFFSLFRYGYEFVLLFFVLSGFVIHSGFANKLKQNPQSRLNFYQYFFKRIKRIYPPYLLALAITTTLDMAGRANNFSIHYGTTIYPLINQSIGGSNHNIATLMGNVLFLYNEYVPQYGTNGPTWSLKLEWWFYVAYPIFLLISRKHIYYSTLLIILLFVAGFFPAYWPEQLLRSVFSSMVCWWMGVLIAEIVSNRLRIHLLLFSIASLAGFSAIFFTGKKVLFYDLEIACLFSAFLSFLLWKHQKGKNFRILERLKPFGDFSYSLYILHFPVLVFLSGMIMKLNHNALPKHSYYVVAGISLCLLISYLAHFVTEIPFLKPGKISFNN